MTKTALGFAFVGMFAIGYYSRGLGVGEIPRRQPGFMPQSEPPTAAASKPPVGAAEVKPVSPPTAPQSLTPVLPDGGSNAEFTRLMLSCRKTEDSWRSRTLKGVVTEAWSDSDQPYVIAGDQRAQANFKRAMQRSNTWRGVATVVSGDRTFNFESVVRLNGPQEERRMELRKRIGRLQLRGS